MVLLGKQFWHAFLFVVEMPEQSGPDTSAPLEMTEGEAHV